MALVPTKLPSVKPLSMTEVKEHLRISHEDDDNYLKHLIEVATRQVERHTGQLLISQEWSLFLDRWPEKTMIDIPLSPVRSISNIRVWHEDTTPSVIDPSHYYLESKGDVSCLILRNSRTWIQPLRNSNGIEVMLEVGYGDEPASIPSDLREAILLLIGYWFYHRGNEEKQSSYPLTYLEIVKSYRRLRL